MDKRFLLPSSLNESPSKLTKSTSFSELSTRTDESTTDEHRLSEKCGNLIKQFSCEKIYDQKSKNTRQLISYVLKSDNEEQKKTWIKTVATNLSTKVSDSSLQDKNAFLQQTFSFPNHNVKPAHSRRAKCLLAPAKFLIDGNKTELSNVKKLGHFNNHHFNPLINNMNDEWDFRTKMPLLPPVRRSPIYNSDVMKNEACFKETEIQDKGNNDEYDQQSTVDTTELKKRLRRLEGRVNQKSKNKNMSLRCWLSFKFIVIFSILTASLTYFFNDDNLSNKFCNPRFEFGKISQDLRKHIYHQESVINELTEYLIDQSNKTDFEMIVLVGGIGVGKSYTAEIIKNSINATTNVIDVFPPLINKDDEIYASLSICRCNLIRLENLKADNIPEAAAFVDKLKKKVQDYCVLVIAMFNTQITDENLKKTMDIDKSIPLIKQAFNERKLKPTLISYKSMGSEALTKCIEDAARYSNIKLTNTDVKNILHDLLIANNGCKGVYAKVQLRSFSTL